MKFIVIGDIMVDKTIYGEVNKISPEAPIPVLEYKYETNVLGGAANVARNLAALGHKVYMGGYVGHAALELFKNEPNIDIGYTTECVKDNIKLRYVDIKTGYQLIRVDDEATTLSYGEIKNGPWEVLDGDFGAVLLSDYEKGVLDLNIADIITTSNAYQVPVIVDTRRSRADIFHGASWLMPNRKERDAIIQEHDLRGDEGIVELLGLRGMVVTLSDKGMYLVERSGSSLTIPPTAKNVVDVTGAGDTAMAGFAIALAQGHNPYDSMIFANHCAGLVCQKRGTSVVTLEELKNIS